MPYSSHRKHSATSQQTMPFPDSRFVFDKRKTIHYHHLKFKIVIKRVEKRSVWYIWLRRQLNDRIMCANGALPVAQWPACIGWLSWMFLALYQSAKSLFSSFAQCFFSVLICVWSLFICFLVFFFILVFVAMTMSFCHGLFVHQQNGFISPGSVGCCAQTVNF